MKHKLCVSVLDLPDVMFDAVPRGNGFVLFARVPKETFEVKEFSFRQVTFRAAPAGDSIVLFARVSREEFDQVCEAGSDLEDLEFDDDIEAYETTEGYSA